MIPGDPAASMMRAAVGDFLFPDPEAVVPNAVQDATAGHNCYGAVWLELWIPVYRSVRFVGQNVRGDTVLGGLALL